MKVVIRNEELTTIVTATWTAQDLYRAKLDRIDMAQLKEKHRSGADILLDAELIVRRIEEGEKV